MPEIRLLLGGMFVRFRCTVKRSCISFLRHAVDSINVVTTTFEVLLKTHGQQMEIAKEVSILAMLCISFIWFMKGFSVQCDLGYYLARVFLLMLCSLSMPVLFDAIVRWRLNSSMTLFVSRWHCSVLLTLEAVY